MNKLMNRNEIVDDRSRFYLEHAYFNPLIRYGFSTFGEKPLITGLRGGSGTLYQEGNDYSANTKVQAKILVNECIRSKY